MSAIPKSSMEWLCNTSKNNEMYNVVEGTFLLALGLLVCIVNYG